MEGEICVSIKLAARPSFNRFAAERGVHSLRAANFFFLILLCEDGRDPLPRKRTLFVSQASANFCDGP